MIYVILGKTNSGKSSLLRHLKELGYKTTPTCTTRPMRVGEVDGRDYNFISKELYDELLKEKLIVAPNTYTVANGQKWSYGLRLSDINLEEDTIIILEPSGYKDLVNRFGKEKIRGILLNVDYEIRLMRGLNRGDSAAELLRRLESDEVDFMGIGNEVFHIINGLNKTEILEETLHILGGMPSWKF